MGSMVSWSDYAGFGQNAFGNGPIGGGYNESDAIALNKALVANNGLATFNGATVGDGSALRVESLESTLKNTTYSMKEIVLWKNVPKMAARNTIEQWNELSSYSNNPDGAWLAEGAAPNPTDSTYIRRDAQIKYMGVTRGVTYQMTLVQNAHGDAIATETVAGTMDLLRKVEANLYYGNSALSPLQWDGFVTQIINKSPASNIIDMMGSPLDEDSLQDGAVTASDAPNYGNITHLVLAPKARADLVKSFFPRGRFDEFSSNKNGMIGFNLQGYTAGPSDVQFLSSPFINDGGAPYTPTTSIAGAPATPSVTTALTTPTNASSLFMTPDAGNYYIIVQAVNRYGRSAPLYVVQSSGSPASSAIAAGQIFQFGVTPAAGNPTEWFEVFRTPVGLAAGTERQTLRVPNINPTTGLAMTTENTVQDFNVQRPGTTIALGLEMTKECLSVKQLCPMVKIPTAITATTIPWFQLIMLTPCLYTPAKVILYRNIGRAAGFVGAAV